MSVNRHGLDPISLLFGLAFAVVGLVLLGGESARGTVSLTWAGPAAAIGVALLMVLAVRPRRPEQPKDATDDAE